MFTYEELLIIIMCSAWIRYTEVQISTCALNIREFKQNTIKIICQRIYSRKKPLLGHLKINLVYT